MNSSLLRTMDNGPLSPKQCICKRMGQSKERFYKKNGPQLIGLKTIGLKTQINGNNAPRSSLRMRCSYIQLKFI